MLRAILFRTMVFALLWWGVAEGRVDSWPLGAVAVVAAVAASIHLLPPVTSRIRLGRLPGFLAYFVWHSLAGGMQVALLALRGRGSLQPAIVEFELTLPQGTPRFLLLYVLGLMPGSLGVELAGARLRFHVVDGRLPTLPQLQALQSHIAHLFGVGR